MPLSPDKPSHSGLQSAAKAAIVFFVLLLIGAFVFYRQRIMIDAAYITFHIIHKEELLIQANRYGSFITQCVVLLGAKLHLPLKPTLVAYSASFNLFYLAGAWILYRVRQYELVLLMALYFSLYVSDTYFWTNNELHQGVCWMFLMFGLMLQGRQQARTWPAKLGYYLLFTLLAFLSLYTHPTVMIPMGFLWGFYILMKDRFRFSIPEIVLHSAIFIGIIVFKMLSSLEHSYDGVNIRKLGHINIYDVLATFTSGVADRFWKGCLQNYWLLPILFICSVYVLVKTRHYWLLTWAILGNLAFFVVVCIVFGGDCYPFYLESELMPFAILACTPFVYFLLPKLQKPTLWVTLILAIRLCYISYSANFFIARTAAIDKIVGYMRDRNIRKIIIPWNQKIVDQLQETWALPYESFYLSVLSDGIARTAICRNDWEIGSRNIEETKEVFIAPFGDMPAKDFSNHFYFHPDTSHSYIVVPYPLIDNPSVNIP